MLKRLRDIWNNARRVFFLAVMLIGIALLTVIILSPDSLKQFIENISIILRILLLLAIYGSFGFYAYTVLTGQQRAKGLTGLISRVGGNVSSIEVKIARDTIDKAITELAGIQSVEVDLIERRGRAVIRLSITLSEENVNILQKQNEIRRRLDHVVRKQLGIAYAEDPVIALRAKGTTPTQQKPADAPQPVPTSPPPATPKPVVEDAKEDDNPEWQMILKASQQPSAEDTAADDKDDKKDEA